MQKRVVSLLLAAVLLCSLACCAWADEEDKYQAFVDTYGPEYDSIDWEQAIADLGGLDAVDWTALFYAAGYEGAKKIKTDPVLSFVGEDAFSAMAASGIKFPRQRKNWLTSIFPPRRTWSNNSALQVPWKNIRWRRWTNSWIW